MNTKTLFGLGVLVATVSACSTVEQDFKDDELFTKEKKEVVITATVEGQPETRTVLKSDDLSVLWRPADEIKVFSAGEASKFISQNSENQKAVNFLGTISVITGTAEGTDIDTHIYGLYPYTDEATMTDGSFTTALPSVQTGLAESFDDDLFISIGRSYTFSMGFWNVCSGYRFSFTEGGYQSVTMSSNDGTPLAGTFVVTFDDNGKPVISSHPVPSSSVTMNAPEGGFVPNTYYYLVVLPGTHAEGFTFTAVNASGETGTYAINEEKIMNRSKFKQIIGLDEMLVFSPTIPSDNEVWYKSTDGEIVTPSGAVWNPTDAVYPISNTYDNGRGVISFEEGKRVTFIQHFKNKTTLKEIILPSSVETISSSAFSGCTNLDVVSLQDGVSFIDVGAFEDCESLSTFSFPSSLNKIYMRAFKNTRLPSATINVIGDLGLGGSAFDIQGMESLSIIAEGSLSYSRQDGPKSVYLEASSISGTSSSYRSPVFATQEKIEIHANDAYSFQMYACNGNTALSEVIIDTPQTSVFEGTFQDCSNLVSVSLPSGLLRIQERAFQSCIGLTVIDFLPESLIYIGPYAFRWCTGLNEIHIPANVSSIGNEAFSGCANLEQIAIHSETPPSLGDSSFDFTNDCPIVVPSQSVETYKTAWPQYQHRIVSEGMTISETSINLVIQQTKSISATYCSLSPSADRSITWSSNNPSVATVNNGSILGISGGVAIITASSAFGTVSCEVTVFEPVDLGLSVKWCPFNLGATSSEEAGDYYAWGETNPKPTYTSGNYMYTGTSSVLPLDADAAHVQLGGNWRMPTKEEWEELIENCYFSLVNRNGTYGWVIRGGDGYSGNSIFLPFVGYRIGETLYDDSDAHYWSSTKPFHYHAYWDYDGNRDDEITSSCSINCGLTIRPVYVE